MIGLRLHCDDIVLRCAADGFAGVVLGCLMSDDGTLLIKVELMEQQRANVWRKRRSKSFGSSVKRGILSRGADWKMG